MFELIFDEQNLNYLDVMIIAQSLNKFKRLRRLGLVRQFGSASNNDVFFRFITLVKQNQSTLAEKGASCLIEAMKSNTTLFQLELVSMH